MKNISDFTFDFELQATGRLTSSEVIATHMPSYMYTSQLSILKC